MSYDIGYWNLVLTTIYAYSYFTVVGTTRYSNKIYFGTAPTNFGTGPTVCGPGPTIFYTLWYRSIGTTSPCK